MAAKKGTKRTSKVSRAKRSSSPTTKREAKPTKKAKPNPKLKEKAKAKKTAQKATKRTPQQDNIICGAHGDTPVTFMCRHLAGGIACGFHAGPSAPDNPWPDAWCDLCDQSFQAAGGKWNEKNEMVAQIQVLCTHCYEAARARNEKVPAFARTGTLTEEQTAELLHHAQALQDKADEQWHWRKMSRWDLDHRAGTLTFSDLSRGPIVADVQLVGSYSTKSNTFQWAWQTFEDGAPEAAAVTRLRVFGEVRGIENLTRANWECDEGVGWEMTALAAHVLGAEGMYRAPVEHVRWFMLLSNWRHLN